MEAQIARNRKARENKKKSWEKRFVKEIVMEEVQLHYSCICKVFPKVILDKRKDYIEVYMTHKCPKCTCGNLRKLTIGEYKHKTNGICDKPGCNCENVFYRIPREDFYEYLGFEVN